MTQRIPTTAAGARRPSGGLWWGVIRVNPSFKMKSKEDCRIYFEEQKKRCGVEYFDVYMLHWLNAAHYEIAEKFCRLIAMGKTEEEISKICGPIQSGVNKRKKRLFKKLEQLLKKEMKQNKKI